MNKRKGILQSVSETAMTPGPPLTEKEFDKMVKACYKFEFKEKFFCLRCRKVFVSKYHWSKKAKTCLPPMPGGKDPFDKYHSVQMLGKAIDTRKIVS